MKKLLFALLLFASPAFGQIAKGNITATGSTCTTTNACVQMVLPANSGGVSITLSGTFTATATFEVIGGSGLQSDKQTVTAFPTNSTTGVTTASAPGTWTASVGGMTIVQVRCSAFTSGTIVVTIQATPALTAAILAGAGGGGGGCSPSASAGQILYSPAGTNCAGVAGSAVDATGDVSIAPTTSGAGVGTLNLTADSFGNNILCVNANGSPVGTCDVMLIASNGSALIPNGSWTFTNGVVAAEGIAATGGDGVTTNVIFPASGSTITVSAAINPTALTTGGVSNTDLAGSVTNSGGTGSYSFAATLSNVPICWARSNTSIADILSVSVTTSSITVTTTGATSTWVYGCTLRN